VAVEKMLLDACITPDATPIRWHRSVL